MTSPMRHIEVARLLREADPLGERRPSPSRPRAALARWGTVALLAIALVGATPQGRAAVDWAAEQVGLAEVGDKPTLDDRRQNGSAGFSTDESTGDVRPGFKQLGPAVVIGSGLAPEGTPYEVVAYRAPDATCISFEWPTVSRSEPSCTEVGIGEQRIGTFAVAAVGAGAPDGLVVQGEVGVRVERVELTYADEADAMDGIVEARVFQLRGRLASQLEQPVDPIGAFVGFLPAGVSSRDLVVKIRAYDDQGRLVHTRSMDASAADAERRRLLSQAREMRSAFVATYEEALRVVQSGELEASVDPARAAVTLRQAIAVDRGELELTRAEGNRLEEEMIELLARLRAAGDVPDIGRQATP